MFLTNLQLASVNVCYDVPVCGGGRGIVPILVPLGVQLDCYLSCLPHCLRIGTQPKYLVQHAVISIKMYAKNWSAPIDQHAFFTDIHLFIYIQVPQRTQWLGLYVRVGKVQKVTRSKKQNVRVQKVPKVQKHQYIKKTQVQKCRIQ